MPYAKPCVGIMLPSNSSLPKIAIVGRPNVGKSTLFNRLIGRRRSIVQRESGTTRDRLYEKISWNGRDISVIDTGGLRFERENRLAKLIDKEVIKAIKEADMILFTVDAKDGLTAQDEELADYLRKNKPKDSILLLANKADNPNDNIPPEFYKLGFTVFGGISALHGINTGELLDIVVEKFPISAWEEKTALFRLAIMGKQNVGKSTYLNALLKEERAMVSEIPGTTRDYIEELLEWRGITIKLIDTAGLRTKRKIKDASDFFSLSRTREALEACDIALLVFDASEPFGADTKATVELIHDLYKGCVLVANKWDLVKGLSQEAYSKDLFQYFKFLSHYPICYISALRGKGLDKPLELAVSVYDSYKKKITTNELNTVLKKIENSRAWPAAIRLKYIVQTGSKPPSFSVFMKGKKMLTGSNTAYLENQIVKHLSLTGTRIRLSFREEKTR